MTSPSSLQTVIRTLETIAPPGLAAAWDKVGPLVLPDPSIEVRNILLTIDFTEDVLKEALHNKSQLVISYHPLIFEPLGSVRADSPHENERIVASCLRHGIAVYSPHTALDAVSGGISDWLCEGLGPGSIKPLLPVRNSSEDEYKIVVFVPQDNVTSLRQAMGAAGAGIIGEYEQCSFQLQGKGTFVGSERSNPVVGDKQRLETVEEVRLEMICGEAALPNVASAIKNSHPYEEPAWDVYKLAAKPVQGAAQARVFEFAQPLTVTEVSTRIKSHLGLSTIRVATPDALRSDEIKLQNIAICPGAGGAAFSGTNFDAYWTGEMRHHDILSKLARGQAVFLSEHTHTERGFLPILAAKLKVALKDVVCMVSTSDRDPLVYV